MNPLAVSLGDPAGIGPEVIAKAWAARHAHDLPPFFAVGDPRSISAVWDGPVAPIVDPAEALTRFDTALPIFAIDEAEVLVLGQPNMPGARCALHSLEIAVGITRSGAAGALVTGPVNKAQLYAAGFTHPGQTEFVAERCGVASANTAMLRGVNLRPMHVTRVRPQVSTSAANPVRLMVRIMHPAPSSVASP